MSICADIGRCSYRENVRTQVIIVPGYTQKASDHLHKTLMHLTFASVLELGRVLVRFDNIGSSSANEFSYFIRF